MGYPVTYCEIYVLKLSFYKNYSSEVLLYKRRNFQPESRIDHIVDPQNALIIG